MLAQRSSPSDRLPNLFIVGAVKSGTTSLHSYLGEHPEVFMTTLKEPHYFSQVEPKPKHRNFLPIISDEERYRALFSAAGDAKVVGEASPSYLWDSHTPMRIYEKVPDARIVIMLRDPIERAHSHYLMEYRAGRERLPFAAAVQADYAAEQKGWGISFLYVELGLYFQQVKRYLDLFGENNVSIILFSDFCADPAVVIRRLARALDINEEPVGGIQVEKTYNPFELPRSELARRLNNNAPVRVLSKRLFPSSVRRFVRDNFLFKQGPKPPMDASAKRFLIELYEPNIEKLEALLKRDLSPLRKTW